MSVVVLTFGAVSFAGLFAGLRGRKLGRTFPRLTSGEISFGWKSGCVVVTDLRTSQFLSLVFSLVVFCCPAADLFPRSKKSKKKNLMHCAF